LERYRPHKIKKSPYMSERSGPNVWGLRRAAESISLHQERQIDSIQRESSLLHGFFREKSRGRHRHLNWDTRFFEIQIFELKVQIWMQCHIIRKPLRRRVHICFKFPNCKMQWRAIHSTPTQNEGPFFFFLLQIEARIDERRRGRAPRGRGRERG
jgi:hypothetical protein